MSKWKELFSDWRYIKISFYVTFTAALLYILYFIIKNFDGVLSSIGGFFGSILTALSPLIIALILAYLLSPLVEIVDKRLMSLLFFRLPDKPKKREKRLHLRRTMSILLTYLLIVAIIMVLIYAFAFLIVGQLVFDSLTIMLERIIAYFSHYEDVFHDFLQQLPDSGLEERFEAIFQNMAVWISEHLSAEAVIGAVTSLGGSLVNLVLGMVISIYLIKDKDFFIRLYRKAVHVLLPMKYSAVLNEALIDIDQVFSKFLRGQLLDALIVATITSIILTIIDLDFAVLLGTFAGITNIIPYFGPVFGAIPAIIVALLTGGLSKALVTLVAFIVIQQIDSDFIYPKVVGSSTGLHPVFVLLAVTFGGYFWGIAGMILAVPILACIKLFLIRKLGELEK